MSYRLSYICKFKLPVYMFHVHDINHCIEFTEWKSAEHIALLLVQESVAQMVRGSLIKQSCELETALHLRYQDTMKDWTAYITIKQVSFYPRNRAGSKINAFSFWLVLAFLKAAFTLFHLCLHRSRTRFSEKMYVFLC